MLLGGAHRLVEGVAGGVLPRHLGSDVEQALAQELLARRAGRELAGVRVPHLSQAALLVREQRLDALHFQQPFRFRGLVDRVCRRQVNVLAAGTAGAQCVRRRWSRLQEASVVCFPLPELQQLRPHLLLPERGREAIPTSP